MLRRMHAGVVRMGDKVEAVEEGRRFVVNRHNKVKLVASLRGKYDVQVRHLCRLPVVLTHLTELLGAQDRLAQRKYMDLPEIAVVGRTNSGKSSLINHLLAKTVSRAEMGVRRDLQQRDGQFD
jgi:ribosome biogenesis GTPase A